MTDPKQELRDVLDILKDFDTAMLVTRTHEGRLRARPMNIARAEEDGDLWFFTSVESGKVDELMDDAHCAAVMQGNRKQLSLSGHAEVVHDRIKIDALWRDEHSTWFEGGKSDPSLVLLHFVAEEAEYWDSSAPKVLRRIFELAKALWRKQPPAVAKDTDHTRTSS